MIKANLHLFWMLVVHSSALKMQDERCSVCICLTIVVRFSLYEKAAVDDVVSQYAGTVRDTWHFGCVIKYTVSCLYMLGKRD